MRALAGAVIPNVDPSHAIRSARMSDPGALPLRYVPSTDRAQTELGLRQRISLQKGLRRIVAWHQLK
jgi:nucleoside-diphosphate-sugar epimerase